MKNSLSVLRKCGKSPEEYTLTEHANLRLQERGISIANVELAIKLGRISFVRGAKVFAIGRKEIKKLSKFVPELRELDGLQVICSKDNFIKTAYFNSDLRSLRRKSKFYCHRRASVKTSVVRRQK